MEKIIQSLLLDGAVQEVHIDVGGIRLKIENAGLRFTLSF